MSNNRWLCVGCNSWNPKSIPRCSFCSKGRASEETSDTAVEKLTKDLHNTIEKLNPRDRKRMWRWLEDNVL